MKKSLTDKFQKQQYILFAFLATTVTMLAVYLLNGVIPFGDKTVLRMDLYHQYGPLFAELYDKVKEGGSFFYSWVSGLGSCFLGNYFNYLSSPIGAIVMFFGHENIPAAIGFMVLIKAALSSSTFTYYVKHSLKSQNLAVVGFSVLYAFCGYMLAYYWNVMWLDAMVLLPVILLGIERIIKYGKPATYIVGLALSMFSNYYMSYMLCIFAVIYFFYYYCISCSYGEVLDESYRSKKGIVTKLKNSRFFRSGFLFAVSSLAAAGIMACALLPVANVLTTSSATSGVFPKSAETYFTFFDFLANHLSSLTTTIRSSGDNVLPNVYCGIATLILVPLYFFTKSISKKEKLATIILLAVLYVSFDLNILNYIWHGFHYPNDLPYRQSFIYSFILLIIAYKTFVRLREFTTRQIGVVGVAIIAFVFAVEKLTSANAGTATIILSVALTVLYVFLLTLFKDKAYDKSALIMLLLLCMCSEVVMCDTASLNISVENGPYTSDYEEFTELKESLDTIEQGDFYRMELTNLRTRMDPSWYGYNGVSVFSSMANQDMSGLQRQLGMMGNGINSYTYNPQTPVYNMMFSLKYIVNNDTFNVLDSSYYSATVQTTNFQAYKNNYYLPIAYCVNSETEFWGSEVYVNEWKAGSDSDPFKMQGDFFDYATGEGNPFEKLDISFATYSNVNPFSDLKNNYFTFNKTTADASASVVFYVTTEKAGNVYIYFKTSGANGENVTVSSSRGTTTQSTSQYCLLDLGYYNEGETISVTIPLEENSGDIRFFPYTVNDDILNAGYEKLKNNQMIVESFEDTDIKGKFTAKEDCLLYTSIPYDKGWKVILDGNEVADDNIVSLGNAILAVRVEKGNHTIEFVYEVPGLTAGIGISVMTLIIILIVLLMSFIGRRKKCKKSLPQFACMDNYFSEDIFLPEIKAVAPAEKPIPLPSFSELTMYNKPRREVIMPPKKEIIAPPQITKSDLSVSDIDESSKE